MNLQQIEYVIMVAQEKSFSKAAKKLFITQPALSQVISKLEGQLGIKIFDRSTTPFQITQAGNIFLKHASEILLHEQQMRNELQTVADFKSASLNIASTPFISSSIIVPSISIFAEKFSKVDINVEDGAMYSIHDLLTNGIADIAISAGTFRNDLFNTELLISNPVYVCVSENSNINRRLSAFRLSADDIINKTMKYFSVPSIPISEFRNEKFVLQKSRFSNNELHQIFHKHFGFDPDVSFYAHNIETIYSFMLSGLGAAFIPEIFIKYSNLHYHGVYYKADMSPLKLHIVSKKSRTLSRSAEEYIKILHKFAKNLN